MIGEFESEDGFVFEFQPEPPTTPCCWTCGGELDVTVCYVCGLLWGPRAVLFEERLDG